MRIEFKKTIVAKDEEIGMLKKKHQQFSDA
jgi:hypothetical protein